MKCKKCSYEISGLTKFCPQCGEKVDTERHCPNCGELLGEEAKFCGLCGYDIVKRVYADDSANAEELHSKASVQIIENEQDNNSDSTPLDATDVVVSNTVGDKKTSRAAAHKIMILLTFIIFFFPICTVSCAGEKITSPNAYEIAYNFGLNQTQMETLDMTIEDVASPVMGVVLLLMAVGLLVPGTVAHTGQATIAFLGMLVLKNNDKLTSLSEAGVDVKFTIWYNLSLITLFLAATAFLWAPKLLSKYKRLVRLDKFLSPAILVTIIVAVVLNPQIFTGIGAAVYNHSERDAQYEVAGNATGEFDSMIDDITLDDIPEVQDYVKETIIESTTEAITYNTDILQEEVQYFIIPDAQTAYYTYGDLAELSKEELRLARNEIYARRGRKFETADLNEYFSSQPWYYGYLSADEFDESVFNGYEKANLDLIKYIEETLSPNSDENLGIANSDDYYEGDLYPISGNSMYVVNCKESITLRENPSTSANEITQIPLYAAVTYIGEAANGFLEVSYNGRIGYALSSYLDVYEPQVASGVMCTVVNCNTSITLRTSPSTKAQEICQISLGESVYYIEAAANDFYLVSYNGMTGYALSSYLEFD